MFHFTVHLLFRVFLELSFTINTMQFICDNKYKDISTQIDGETLYFLSNISICPGVVNLSKHIVLQICLVRYGVYSRGAKACF